MPKLFLILLFTLTSPLAGSTSGSSSGKSAVEAAAQERTPASAIEICLNVFKGSTLESKFTELCAKAQDGFGDCFFEAKKIFNSEEAINTCLGARKSFSFCHEQMRSTLSAKETILSCSKVRLGFRSCYEAASTFLGRSEVFQNCAEARSGFPSCWEALTAQLSMGKKDLLEICIRAKSEAFGSCFDLGRKFLNPKPAAEKCINAKKAFLTCNEGTESLQNHEFRLNSCLNRKNEEDED